MSCMAGTDWAFFSKDYFLLKEQVEFRTGFLETPVLPAWVCFSSSFKMLLLDEWKGHCITATCETQQVTFLSTELSVWHGCHLFNVTAGMCLCSCSMESLSKKQIIWLLRCFLCKRKFNSPATSEDEELSNTYFILQYVVLQSHFWVLHSVQQILLYSPLSWWFTVILPWPVNNSTSPHISSRF